MTTNTNTNTPKNKSPKNKSSLDVDKLEKALDNTKNESIMNFTTKKITELNYKILQELNLDNKTTMEYLKKLKDYKYVDELPELKHGGFIRWIPTNDPNYLPLNTCGIVCDIKIADEGVFVTCKNFMHRHYNFKMDDVLIFQKLTTQEQIILSALDHLDEDDSKNTNSNKNTKDLENDDDLEDDDDDLEDDDDDLEDDDDE
jgi:flagellar biosynthesis/type III secretory pathway chaperone